MTDYQVLISLNLPLTTASKLRDVQDEERNFWKWPHHFLIWCGSVTKSDGAVTVSQMHLLQIPRLLQDNSLTMSGPSRHKRSFSFLFIKGKRKPMRICSMNKHKWLTFTWVGCYYISAIKSMSRYYSGSSSLEDIPRQNSSTLSKTEINVSVINMIKMLCKLLACNACFWSKNGRTWCY